MTKVGSSNPSDEAFSVSRAYAATLPDSISTSRGVKTATETKDVMGRPQTANGPKYFGRGLG